MIGGAAAFVCIFTLEILMCKKFHDVMTESHSYPTFNPLLRLSSSPSSPPLIFFPAYKCFVTLFLPFPPPRPSACLSSPPTAQPSHYYTIQKFLCCILPVCFCNYRISYYRNNLWWGGGGGDGSWGRDGGRRIGEEGALIGRFRPYRHVNDISTNHEG